jgi:hypothetical protein
MISIQLIKKTIREYCTPQLVIEFKLKTGLFEVTKYLGKINNDYDPKVLLYNNTHSLVGVSSKSSFSRVETERILESLMEYKDEIISFAKKIIKNCENNCSIVVADYSFGFDYHMWVDVNNAGDIKLTINTSIEHPKKLYNTKNSPTIIIDVFGNFKYSNIDQLTERFLKKRKPLI